MGIKPIELQFAPKDSSAFKKTIAALVDMTDVSIQQKEEGRYFQARTGNHAKARVKSFAMCNPKDIPTEIYVNFLAKRITVSDASGLDIKFGVGKRITSNIENWAIGKARGDD